MLNTYYYNISVVNRLQKVKIKNFNEVSMKKSSQNECVLRRVCEDMVSIVYFELIYSCFESFSLVAIFF